MGVGPEDVVFVTCSFYHEVVPLVRLKRRFGFVYLPSHFLFLPFIFENLARGYRFPALKYLVLWFYERFLFRKEKSAADGFVITNDSDLRHFPEAMRARVFAIYGGEHLTLLQKAHLTINLNIIFPS